MSSSMMTMMFFHHVFKKYQNYLVHYHIYLFQQKNMSIKWMEITEEKVFNLSDLFQYKLIIALMPTSIDYIILFNYLCSL